MQKGHVSNAPQQWLELAELEEPLAKILVKNLFPLKCIGTDKPVIFRGKLYWKIGFYIYIEDNVCIHRASDKVFILCVDEGAPMRNKSDAVLQPLVN